MTDVKSLITDNIDLWTSAIKRRNSQGRGSNSKVELVGVKKLRELILELAVRGKLVPQDPNDEPASVLLDKIAEEKAQLIADKKIKKTKPLPVVTDKEKLFVLPLSWEWCRFGDLAQHNSGKTLDKGRNSGKPKPYLTTSNLYWGRFRLDNVKEMLIEDDQLDKCTAIFGDLLICEGGEAGRAAVWQEKTDVCFQNHIHRARFYSSINPFFMYRFFEYLTATGVIDNYRKGVGISNMSGKSLSSIVTVLPPLAEQHRIVAKVDELMVLCDQLEQQTENSITAHQTLVEELLNALFKPTDIANTAQDFSQENAQEKAPNNVKAAAQKAENCDVKPEVQNERQHKRQHKLQNQQQSDFEANWQRIADHFDVLFTTEASIDQLKQTILQLAVMGKLVPQNPSDEPASKLLEKIAEEKAQLIKDKKIKKQKELPEITDEEKRFELPNGWAWSRLQDITLLITDGKHGDCNNLDNSGYYFLSAKDVQNGKLLYEHGRQIEPSEFEEVHQRTNLECGDICMVNTGATVGKMALVEDNKFTKKTTFQKSVAVIKVAKPYVHNEFVALFIQSETPNLLKKSGGSAINNLLLGDLKIKVTQFPPLNEQHRIVAKVDELMALCDQLKTRLADAQITQLHLADAVVENALN